MHNISAFSVPKTANQKTGAVAVTYRSQESCPTDCPLRGSGCYAETGPVGIHTRRLNRSGASVPEIAREHAAAIDALPADRALRIDIVGDDPTPESARATGRTADRYRQRGGGPIWKYTHAWRRIARNAWGASISLLASCETREDVTEAHAQGFAVALAAESFETAAEMLAGSGFRPVPCPAQTGRAASCDTCRLCWRDDALRAARSVIVFQAHGSGAKRARDAIAQRNA